MNGAQYIFIVLRWGLEYKNLPVSPDFLTPILAEIWAISVQKIGVVSVAFKFIFSIQDFAQPLIMTQ